MSREKERKVYVVGHKNPDTDSICSAIVYAALKTKLTGRVHEPRRAGQLNEETQYVLSLIHICLTLRNSPKQRTGMEFHLSLTIHLLRLSTAARLNGARICLLYTSGVRKRE